MFSSTDYQTHLQPGNHIWEYPHSGWEQSETGEGSVTMTQPCAGEENQEVMPGIWLEEGEEVDGQMYQKKLATQQVAKREAERAKEIDNSWLQYELQVQSRILELEREEGVVRLLKPIPESEAYQQQFAETHNLTLHNSPNFESPKHYEKCQGSRNEFHQVEQKYNSNPSQASGDRCAVQKTEKQCKKDTRMDKKSFRSSRQRDQHDSNPYVKGPRLDRRSSILDHKKEKKRIKNHKRKLRRWRAKAREEEEENIKM